MTKNIVISGETLTGKTLVALGVAAKLQKQGHTVGYFKPVGSKSFEHSSDSQDVDEDAAVMKEILELEVDVLVEGVVVAEKVDADRVIDDEVDRRQRIDLLRVAAEFFQRVAHRGQIDHRRNAGEVLQQHAAGTEGDFLIRLAVGEPSAESLDVIRLHRAAVFKPQHILEQHFHGERQPREIEAKRWLLTFLDIDLGVVDESERSFEPKRQEAA